MTSQPTANPLPRHIPEEEQIRRRALVDKLRAIREDAVRNGLELWDLDRVNEEVRRRRYGDNE